MVTKLDGLFVMDGLSMTTDDERKGLVSMIQSIYGRGDLLDVQITVKKVGTRALCQERNNYGKCHGVLKLDGTCPEQDRHVEQAEEAA